MSAGQTIILRGLSSRQKAENLVNAAPYGAIMNIRPASRTNEQNALMWALLSDISRAKPEGRNLPPDIWKCIFLAACGHKVRFEPAIDGEGVVPIGFRSSRLSKAEMSDVIECIREYGARHQVEWSEQE